MCELAWRKLSVTTKVSAAKRLLAEQRLHVDLTRSPGKRARLYNYVMGGDFRQQDKVSMQGYSDTD